MHTPFFSPHPPRACKWRGGIFAVDKGYKRNYRRTDTFDGKSIRSTVSDYSNEYQNFVSLVSLFSQKREQILHVEKLENREGNEGQTVEELLEILDLKDVVFTLDALHCKKNAQQNRRKRQSLSGKSQGQSAQTQSGG